METSVRESVCARLRRDQTSMFVEHEPCDSKFAVRNISLRYPTGELSHVSTSWGSTASIFHHSEWKIWIYEGKCAKTSKGADPSVKTLWRGLIKSMLNCSSVQIINTETQKNIPYEVRSADVSTGRCRTKGLSVKQWKEIQPPVDCIRINSPVSLATDTSSFLVTGGCWMGREGGGVVCRKTIGRIEKTYFF